MLNVKIILGSVRPNRFSEKVLPWLQQALEGKDMQVEVLDLREHVLPLSDMAAPPSTVKDGNYGDAAVNAWALRIKEADAFIVVAPEYNHGYTAVLKNAFDVVYAEWHRKAIGFVAYGSVGGARAVEQLRQVAVEVHMASVRTSAHIQSPWLLLDESGNLKEGSLSEYDHQLAEMLGQLEWWGNALKEAREKAA